MTTKFGFNCMAVFWIGNTQSNLCGNFATDFVEKHTHELVCHIRFGSPCRLAQICRSLKAHGITWSFGRLECVRQGDPLGERQTREGLSYVEGLAVAVVIAVIVGGKTGGGSEFSGKQSAGQREAHEEGDLPRLRLRPRQHALRQGLPEFPVAFRDADGFYF